MRQVGRWLMLAAVVIYLLALSLAAHSWAQSWDVVGALLLPVGFVVWAMGMFQHRRQRTRDHQAWLSRPIDR